jgi:hypothetical protein
MSIKIKLEERKKLEEILKDFEKQFIEEFERFLGHKGLKKNLKSIEGSPYCFDKPYLLGYEIDNNPFSLHFKCYVNKGYGMIALRIGRQVDKTIFEFETVKASYLFSYGLAQIMFIQGTQIVPFIVERIFQYVEAGE